MLVFLPLVGRGVPPSCRQQRRGGSEEGSGECWVSSPRLHCGRKIDGGSNRAFQVTAKSVTFDAGKEWYVDDWGRRGGREVGRKGPHAAVDSRQPYACRFRVLDFRC